MACAAFLKKIDKPGAWLGGVWYPDSDSGWCIAGYPEYSKRRQTIIKILNFNKQESLPAILNLMHITRDSWHELIKMVGSCLVWPWAFQQKELSFVSDALKLWSDQAVEGVASHLDADYRTKIANYDEHFRKRVQAPADDGYQMQQILGLLGCKLVM